MTKRMFLAFLIVTRVTPGTCLRPGRRLTEIFVERHVRSCEIYVGF